MGKNRLDKLWACLPKATLCKMFWGSLSSAPLLYMHTELAPFLYFSLKDNIVCCQTVQISWETKEWYNPTLALYTNVPLLALEGVRLGAQIWMVWTNLMLLPSYRYLVQVTWQHYYIKYFFEIKRCHHLLIYHATRWMSVNMDWIHHVELRQDRYLQVNTTSELLVIWHLIDLFFS